MINLLILVAFIILVIFVSNTGESSSHNDIIVVGKRCAPGVVTRTYPSIERMQSKPIHQQTKPLNESYRNIMIERATQLTSIQLDQYRATIKSIVPLNTTTTKFTILDLKDIANSVNVKYGVYIDSVKNTLPVIDTQLEEPYIPPSNFAKSLMSYPTYDAYLHAFYLTCASPTKYWANYDTDVKKLLLLTKKDGVHNEYDIAVNTVFIKLGLQLRTTAYPTDDSILYGTFYNRLYKLLGTSNVMPDMPNAPNFKVFDNIDLIVNQMFTDKINKGIPNDIYNTGDIKLQSGYEKGSTIEYIRNFSDISDDYLRLCYADNKISSELTYSIRSEDSGQYFNGSNVLGNTLVKWKMLEYNDQLWISYADDVAPNYNTTSYYMQENLIYQSSYPNRTVKTVNYDIQDYRIKSVIGSTNNVPSAVIREYGRKPEGVNLGALKTFNTYDVPVVSMLYHPYIATTVGGYTTKTNMDDIYNIAKDCMLSAKQVNPHLWKYGKNYYNRVTSSLHSNVYLLFIYRQGTKFQLIKDETGLIFQRATDNLSDAWLTTSFTATITSVAVYESSNVLPDYSSPIYYSMQESYTTPILYQLPDMSKIYPYVTARIFEIHPTLNPYGKSIKALIHADLIKLTDRNFLMSLVLNKSIDNIPTLSIDYVPLDFIKLTPEYNSISTVLSPLGKLLRWLSLKATVSEIRDIFSITYGSLWTFDQISCT